MTRQEFINSYGPLIKNVSSQTGILPELVTSVAFIEAQGPDNILGSEPQARDANNYFGIVADKGWTGEVYTDTLNRKWRKYDSIEDSVRDFFQFIKGNANYKPLFDAKDLAGQAAALEAGHYAGTGSGYADLLGKIAGSVKKALDAIKEDAIEIGTVGALASIAALIYIVWPKKIKAITGLNGEQVLTVGAIAAAGGAIWYFTKDTKQDDPETTKTKETFKASQEVINPTPDIPAIFKVNPLPFSLY